MTERRIDWRERATTTLSDLYDGDYHLVIGVGRTKGYGRRPRREEITIPHPLPGVRYADCIYYKGGVR